VSRSAAYVVRRGPFLAQVAYRLRIVSVFARTEFKLKYAGSALGYLWSLAKPSLYFAILWIVFGHLFQTNIPHFPVYLVVGVALYTFLADAVSLSLPSIVVRGAVLRRIAFPSLTIPLATTASTALTFLLNCIAAGIFIGASGIAPRVGWLMLVPLFVEFCVFVLGVSLIFSSLYVRFRDAGQVWEVLSTVILYTSGIMYPLRILPHWAQQVVALSPLVQVVQDARSYILAGDPRAATYTSIAAPHVFPVLIAFAVLALGLALHRHEAPRFAEIA
jgi:ABC-2 type transport system permease protein